MNSRCKLARAISLLCLATACTPPRKLPSEFPPVAVAELPAGELAPDCVSFWPEARYRSYAYDHVVHLASNCHRMASCNVSTNVTPEEVTVAVPPNEQVEVVTLRGSQTPDFTPRVQCSRGTR